jgi:glyceraldehyde-3-phosphate dehydrogenase (NADP+)
MWEIGRSLGDSEKDRTVDYIYDTIESYKRIECP